MNLNITIDLQDIFDEQNEQAYHDGESGSCGESGYNLKKVVKDEIIKGIKKSISKDCLSAVEEKSKKAIESVISESVNKAKETISDRALGFVDEWLEKKTVISDKWGDPLEELTISELIKQQFDDLLNKNVDEQGRFTNYNGTKLINHLTRTKVKEEVERRMKSFNSDIDKQIKLHIESGIKETVSNKFAEMVIQTARSNQAQLEASK